MIKDEYFLVPDQPVKMIIFLINNQEFKVIDWGTNWNSDQERNYVITGKRYKYMPEAGMYISFNKRSGEYYSKTNRVFSGLTSEQAQLIALFEEIEYINLSS